MTPSSVLVVACLLALGGFGIAGAVLDRRRREGLPRLTDAECLATKPAVVSEATWFAIRACVAGSLQVDANQVDPAWDLEELHDTMKVMEMSSVNVEDMVSDWCGQQHFEEALGQIERQRPRTLAELMAVLARFEP